MSYGKPVIGCRVGGVTEIIEANENGLFAAAGDAADLTDQMNRLIGDEDLRRRLGAQARRTVREKFTKEILAANSLAYYQEAINRLKKN
jgi:glycosyltransferase involved in cell wall biosynthesis